MVEGILEMADIFGDESTAELRATFLGKLLDRGQDATVYVALKADGIWWQIVSP